jgi:hypothetical protein
VESWQTVRIDPARIAAAFGVPLEKIGLKSQEASMQTVVLYSGQEFAQRWPDLTLFETERARMVLAKQRCHVAIGSSFSWKCEAGWYLRFDVKLEDGIAETLTLEHLKQLAGIMEKIAAHEQQFPEPVPVLKYMSTENIKLGDMAKPKIFFLNGEEHLTRAQVREEKREFTKRKAELKTKKLSLDEVLSIQRMLRDRWQQRLQDKMVKRVEGLDVGETILMKIDLGGPNGPQHFRGTKVPMDQYNKAPAGTLDRKLPTMNKRQRLRCVNSKGHGGRCRFLYTAAPHKGLCTAEPPLMTRAKHRRSMELLRKTAKGGGSNLKKTGKQLAKIWKKPARKK